MLNCSRNAYSLKNAKVNEFAADRGDLSGLILSVPSADKSTCVCSPISGGLPLKLGNFYCLLVLSI